MQRLLHNRLQSLKLRPRPQERGGGYGDCIEQITCLPFLKLAVDIVESLKAALEQFRGVEEVLLGADED